MCEHSVVRTERWTQKNTPAGSTADGGAPAAAERPPCPRIASYAGQRGVSQPRRPCPSEPGTTPSARQAASSPAILISNYALTARYGRDGDRTRVEWLPQVG